MDFGFVCASSSDFTKSKSADRVVKSYDGYNSYLLIVDSFSQFVWVFSTASKDPPLTIVNSFLLSQKISQGCHKIIMDLGGDLGFSSQFWKVVEQHEYTPLTIGTDSPQQNGLCKHINATLGIKMRALLHNSGLSAVYCPNAIRHAMYLYNWLLYLAIQSTLIHKYTGL